MIRNIIAVPAGMGHTLQCYTLPLTYKYFPRSFWKFCAPHYRDVNLHPIPNFYMFIGYRLYHCPYCCQPSYEDRIVDKYPHSDIWCSYANHELEYHASLVSYNRFGFFSSIDLFRWNGTYKAVI